MHVSYKRFVLILFYNQVSFYQLASLFNKKLLLKFIHVSNYFCIFVVQWLCLMPCYFYRRMLCSCDCAASNFLLMYVYDLKDTLRSIDFDTG